MDNKRSCAPLLTRAECSALRGIAIIGIFLHNYCHWLGFAVKENEYTFRMSNCRNLMKAVASPHARSSGIAVSPCSSSSVLSDSS